MSTDEPQYKAAVQVLIRKARMGAGLSKAELARRLVDELGGSAATHRTQVTQWESGREVPGGTAVLAVVKLTAFSVDDFIEETFGVKPRRQDGSLQDRVERLERRAEAAPRRSPRPAKEKFS